MIFRQTAFHGGEIAPTFYGRSELDLYKSSLRKCRNMHISHTGQPNKRPGMEFVANAATNFGSRAVRLVPITFLNDLAYVLEFSALKIRVFLNGALVHTITTTYTAAEIWYLKMAQVGAVLTICHRAHAPAELRYVSATSWTLTNVQFQPQLTWGGIPTFASLPAPTGVAPWSALYPYLGVGEYVTYNGQTWKSVVASLNVPPAVGTYWAFHTFDATHVYEESDYVYDTGVLWISLQPNNLNNARAANSQWWALAADLAHPQREWSWTFTYIWKDQYGGTWETGPYAYVSSPSGKWPLALDRPAKILPLSVDPGSPGFTATIIGLRWYRGRNGIFGYVGESESDGTAAGSPAFKDDGIAPDYSRQPPAGTDPFAGGDYPAGVTFHEGRRIFYGSTNKPQTFWGSSIDSVNQFDLTVPVKASDSYEWTVQATRLEEIRSAVGIRNLVLLTGAGEWEVKGNNNGDPISPLAVDAKRQSGWGSDWLDPVLFGYGLLFVQALGTIVRDLTYDFKYGAWAGDDVSHVASHFLDGYQIVDWCFSRVPDRVVWMVRSDGKMLSLTYDRNRDDRTMAWALHETDGVVEAVCSIPEDGEDRVYIVVVRDGARFIERMSKITPSVQAARTISGVDYPEAIDQRYAINLDCAYQWDGTNTTGTTVTIDNPESAYEADTEMDVTLGSVDAANPYGAAGFDAGMVGEEIVLEPNGTPVRLEIVSIASAVEARVRAQANVPAFYQVGGAHTNWGRAKQRIDHPALVAPAVETGDAMSTRGLTALADGSVVEAINDGVLVGSNWWQAGVLFLLKPAVVCTVGLSYNSDIELLDIADNPEARARIKDVSRIFFETTDSRGLWLGETFEDLVEWDQRQVSDEYGLVQPESEIADVFIRASWNRKGRACLRSIDPLPMTLLAVSREVKFGGT